MIFPTPVFVTHDIPAEHTVISGDTLWRISSEVYGTPDDWSALCRANHIADCDLIYPGQRLTIPVDAGHDTAYIPVSPPPAVIKPPVYEVSLSGQLSCSGLEALWTDNGGNPSAAFMAAEIAMAESGGNQYAVYPTDDIGYWQINYPSWGPALATTNADGNARAAIQISDDGTNWEPWTTYQTGAYIGQC